MREKPGIAVLIPLLIALFQLALHIAFHGQYGYFRDELYYIACSNHLAFGYVDQPPLSIAILWMTRSLLGDSLHAIRFLPAVASAAVVLLAALMTRQLGGGRFAQGLAALSVVAAPGLIGHAKFFSMNPFDVFFWALAGYVLVLIFSTDKPQLWILLGVVVGLGLMNKYSMGFLCIGLVSGLLLTSHRRQIASKWFWLGVIVAAVIFLPHVLWQIAHGFPSLEFMHNASQNKNVDIGAVDFLAGQMRDFNFLNVPLWVLGVYFFFTHQQGRYRPLAWIYPTVLILMILTNAKVYYLSPIYPLFLAGGAVVVGEAVKKRGWNWLKPVYPFVLLLVACVSAPFALPVLPVEKFIAYQRLLGLTPRADERSSLGDLPQYYADQFGWEEMVATVATVYNTLKPEEQAECVIYVRNYGEAAAIDFFGKRYGLPNALCAHNSYWFWGPGERTGNVAIIFGGSRDLQENLADLNRRYRHVEFVATTNAKHAMPYENGRMIFLCREMNTTFQELWPEERFFI